jgi:hypothetical protein
MGAAIASIGLVGTPLEVIHDLRDGFLSFASGNGIRVNLTEKGIQDFSEEWVNVFVFHAILGL